MTFCVEEKVLVLVVALPAALDEVDMCGAVLAGAVDLDRVSVR